MKNKKPIIRINNYFSEWKEFKMIDLVTPVVREVLKPSSSYKKLSVRSHAKGTFHQVVEDPNTVAMDKLYLVHENDLIVNITFAWEHAIAIAEEKDHNLLVSHRFPTFLINKSDINFIKYLVSLNSFKNRLDLISPGGAGRNRVLNKKDFNNLKLFVPVEMEEQKKIGIFFTNFDKTIALHQQELDALKQTKQGFLQKMFPKEGGNVPEIRFEGFSGEWESKTFSLLVNRTSKQSNSAILPKLEFEDIISGEGKLNKDISNKFDNRKGILFEPGYILFGKLRPYLKNWLLPDFKGIALGDFWVFTTDYSAEFIYSLIQTSKFQTVANLSSGTKMPRSDWKTVSSTKFLIPSMQEQVKIGEFFRQLDEVIELKEQELQALKQTKKGFLQKMFV